MNENIIHVAGIKMRVTGSGNLIATILSQDFVKSKSIKPIAMQLADESEPFRLVNFVSQKVALRLETKTINEVFKFNRILLYVKPIYTMRPR